MDVFDQWQLPVAVVRRKELLHNIRTLADYCRTEGVSLAPHIKTTMCRGVVDEQLRAGAWGLTVATVRQARACRSWTRQPILIANEVVDGPSLNWVRDQIANPHAPPLLCQVDSVAGVRAMDVHLGPVEPAHPLPVLLEVGHIDGRCGVRTAEEAVQVASAVRQSSRLRLVGVSGFEGTIPRTTPEATLGRVDGFLDMIRATTERLLAARLVDAGEEVVVSAGGSAFFDRVVARLTGGWRGTPLVRTVVRSGCYVLHDCGVYADLSPFGKRAGASSTELRAALEVWAPVLSRPQPDLAVLGMGKRDASFDSGLPVPLYARRQDGSLGPLNGASVVRMNDQHAVVKLAAPGILDVGDLVGCGISHPCTTVDRWRELLLVDDEYRVVDVLETFF